VTDRHTHIYTYTHMPLVIVNYVIVTVDRIVGSSQWSPNDLRTTSRSSPQKETSIETSIERDLSIDQNFLFLNSV
jgi:hypothetical protein